MCTLGPLWAITPLRKNSLFLFNHLSIDTNELWLDYCFNLNRLNRHYIQGQNYFQHVRSLAFYQIFVTILLLN